MKYNITKVHSGPYGSIRDWYNNTSYMTYEKKKHFCVSFRLTI